MKGYIIVAKSDKVYQPHQIYIPESQVHFYAAWNEGRDRLIVCASRTDERRLREKYYFTKEVEATEDMVAMALEKCHQQEALGGLLNITHGAVGAGRKVRTSELMSQLKLGEKGQASENPDEPRIAEEIKALIKQKGGLM